MPTIIPVTPENMNYAIVYLAGILAFAAIYWYIAGRKFYTGPLIEAEVDESASDDVKYGNPPEIKKADGSGSDRSDHAVV